MSEAPERIVPSCVEALENYQQADMDGIMVLASRQAIHETIDAYWARVETCEKLKAKLTKAVESFHNIAKDLDKPESGLTDFGGCEHYRWVACKLRDKARTTLAELTGGKDE